MIARTRTSCAAKHMDVRKRPGSVWMGLFLAFFIVLPTAAHYVRLEDELVSRNTLTLGVALTGRPFAWREEGRIRGFEIAVARAVADSHGLALKVVQLPRSDLLAALIDGEVDAVNSLALVKGDAAVVTIPYLTVGDHVMVLRGNPFRVRTLEDLSGRTVAATSGSSAETYAARVNDRLMAGGHEPMTVHTFPYQRDTNFPVSMGHAAAYFIQTVSAVGISQDPDSRTRLVEGMFQPSREVGFAVARKNDDLVHAVEHAIAAMVATGRYERLSEEYALPMDLSPFR